MKWSKAQFLQSEQGIISFDEELSFDSAAFAKMDHIRGLQNVTVSGTARYEETNDEVIVELSASGIMIVPCSITMEDVELDFHTSSEEIFSFQKSDNEDVHETKGDVLELLPIVFQLILMEVPLKVVKEGIKYPKGKDWEVVKEEDYLKNKNQEIDPRLAKLKDFKVEE